VGRMRRGLRCDLTWLRNKASRRMESPIGCFQGQTICQGGFNLSLLLEEIYCLDLFQNKSML
jgi:hypothetical protein